MLGNELLEMSKSSYSAEEAQLVEYALAFATAAHAGQKRLSGEDYIMHPIAVAKTLLELGMDSPTVVSALLHDVIEDTAVTEEELRKKFGNHITDLVNGVTKLSKIKFNSQEEEQAENIRKLILAMFTDMRVLLIKLSDRLHNMKTLQFQKPEKQQRIARETLEIYAPLAGRLGISTFKIELEDIAMKYLYPEAFADLSSKIVTARSERVKIIDRIIAEIKKQLEAFDIHGEVKGRPKHFYSIYKKMTTGGKSFEQIYDLIAVRVIVDTVKDCYTILGAIHTLWKPIPGRFKDYIAVPKPNMYQSLHTTVVTNFGQIFEIQIRTFDMNKIAEYGVAAHWKYKENQWQGKTSIVGSDENFEKRLRWMREVMEVQGDIKDGKEFVDTLKEDVLNSEIYVFSPRGDVFSMPKGATCLDFAYRVHSAVGDKCVGAKVNGKIVHFDYVLENGDVIEIMTNNASKGPSRDWLSIVKTPTAKAKIRSFFKKQMKDENIRIGRDMLEREARRRGYDLFGQLMVPGWLKIVMDKYSFSSEDDMFASVGYGGVTVGQVLGKLIEFKKREDELKVPESLAPTAPENTRKKHATGIIIDGFDDFLIHLSQCCNPVPGDDIIGYISRGRGVSVHRKDCPNVRGMEKERLIPASWPEGNNNVNCIASLRLDTENKNGMLGQISSAIAAMKIQITAVNARVSKDKSSAVIDIGLEISNTEELSNVINKLLTVDGVVSVSRKQ